jgi:hypothetical protein
MFAPVLGALARVHHSKDSTRARPDRGATR